MSSLRTILATLLIGILIVQNTMTPFLLYARADDEPTVTVTSEAAASNASPDSTGKTDTADAPQSTESEPIDQVTDPAPIETEAGTSSETTVAPAAVSAEASATTSDSTGSSEGTSGTNGNANLQESGVELTGTSTPAAQVSTSTPEQAVSTTTTATSTGPVIQSGESVALANILNIVNTNLVNSVGNALLLNYTQPTGPIDLRNGTPIFSTSTSACALFACSSTEGVSVNLNGDATIHNAIVLNATTGGNEIDAAGNAIISTGDALAGLNLINISNTNIVDSNYLLLTLNAFRGVQGDIIFPSLTNFLSSLAHGLLPGSITLSGNANVGNTVTTTADSGGNDVSHTASSTISTGSTNSSGSVFNQINSNMIGGAAVSILFRIQGNWAGRIFGAPEGLTWTQGPDGMIALFNGGSGGGASSLSQVSASSTSTIDNDVNVMALTGQNRVSNADSALITTGSALASANVLNIANTNVVGKNWIMAIVNIFGDFNGDIAFGRPDLWVGDQAEVPSFIGNGSDVKYTFSVINNGDSVASNVKLHDSFDADRLHIQSASVPYEEQGKGLLSWDLGTIPAGSAVEVTYIARVQNADEGTNISNTASVDGYETDNDMADNTDNVSFSTSRSSIGTTQNPKADDLYKKLLNDPLPVTQASSTALVHLVRDTKATSITSGSTVQEHLTMVNTGTTASHPAIVYDLLQSADGTVLRSQSWKVDGLAPDEGTEFEYSLSFSSKTPAGTYYLSTVITDASGKEDSRYVRNGTIEVAENMVLPALTSYRVNPGSGEREGSILGAVFPGIAVAHASDGNLGAASGLIQVPWYVLTAIFAVIFGILGSTVYRARKRQTG